jgi:AbrB family looped-hinge helix DNA binding protein
MKANIATLTTRGRFVIPAQLRRKYGFRKGTKVAFEEEKGRLVLQPLTRQFLDSLRGSLKGKPPLLETLLEDRKKERKL